MNLRSRLTGIATGDQGIFVRALAVRAVGGFPAIPLMEDVALSTRSSAAPAVPRACATRVTHVGPPLGTRRPVAHDPR